jgi:murein DD-endopeptidase MepM/ murein hydrolase activator NlpD
LGAAFGMGCVSAFSPQMTPQALISASSSPIGAAVAMLPEPPSAVALIGAEEQAETMAPLAQLENSPPPADSKKLYPLVIDLRVENGDTLSNLLNDTGVSPEEAHHVVEAMRSVYNPRSLDVGQKISVHLDMPEGRQAPIVTNLTIPVSPTSTVDVKRKANGTEFAVQKIDAPVETKLVRAGGTINSSLYETGVNSGIPVGLLSEIITAYSYDVDFQRDIKAGHDMDVLFESKQTKSGITAGYGNVLYAELDLGDRMLKIYRYTDKTGSSDYYNEKGESVRKSLLRTPVNGARITSRFGMRNHPILGYTKMHRGVDFGAPTGTPIYAAGDGKVEFAGAKSGYGNYLKIKHNATYATAYGHISRFATGIAPGTKVKQGQIVAYVGATGQATGPHLHYEVLVNNTQVNPSDVKFKTGAVLAGKELAAFKQSKQHIENQLAALPRKIDLAMK